MATQLREVEFETRTIGPLVLTTPVLRRLDFRGIVHRYCPIAEQADLDHGLVAELVTQSRLSDPRALYDLPGWAERCALPTLYPEIERTGQVKIPAASSGAFRAGGHCADLARSASTCPSKESICYIGGICPPNPLTRMPFLPTASGGASWHDFVRGGASTLHDDHLQRLAIVYVRQSHPQHVVEHVESTARQDALVA